MNQQKSFFALFPLLYDWLVLRPVPCPTLMFSINVNYSALLSFVYQINYLPEMAIVSLCNVPVQLKLAADVANFCGRWTYIEYLVIVLFKCSEV